MQRAVQQRHAAGMLKPFPNSLEHPGNVLIFGPLCRDNSLVFGLRLDETSVSGLANVFVVLDSGADHGEEVLRVQWQGLHVAKHLVQCLLDGQSALEQGFRHLEQRKTHKRRIKKGQVCFCFCC